MDQPEVDAIIEVMEAKNYEVFRNERGHNLNIVGIRTDDDSANSFNDWLTVFYSFGNVWNFFAFPATIDTARVEEDTGLHAVNIHRANAHRPSIQVGRWSAGSQVVQDPDQFAFLLMLCDRAKEKFGNNFTYTLLEEEDFA